MMEEKQQQFECCEHEWIDSEQPCDCEGDGFIHADKFCSHCQIDKCEFERQEKALQAQKAKAIEIIEWGLQDSPYASHFADQVVKIREAIKKRLEEEL